MSAVVSERAAKERRVSPDLIALKRFAQTAVSLYKEENTWEYLADQGVPTSQMLFADFDVDQEWEQAIHRLPVRFIKRAQDLHAAVVAARPFKRALVDESMRGVLNVEMTSDEPPVRITAYQEVELAAWEKEQLRGAHTSHVLTDVLLYTHPSFIAGVKKQKKEIETAAHLLLSSVQKAAKIPHDAAHIPAEKAIEGLLTSSISLHPPIRRGVSLTASRR